jgi:hypothetical protein
VMLTHQLGRSMDTRRVVDGDHSTLTNGAHFHDSLRNLFDQYQASSSAAGVFFSAEDTLPCMLDSSMGRSRTNSSGTGAERTTNIAQSNDFRRECIELH